eukprot:14031485-Ditylum_brightwellii.AAC.1
MSSKHDQVTLMTFVRSTQYGECKMNNVALSRETRAKKIDIRKSNVTKVTLVILTASMPTIQMVKNRHDKAATTICSVKNTQQSTSSGSMKKET